MKSTTSAYKQIIASGNTRQYHVRVEMTLADGTIFDGRTGNEPAITDEDIMSGSFRYETASSSTSSFDIGSAIIGLCKFSLKNYDDRFTQYDFFNATATVWVKLEGDSEYIRIGFFTVDEPSYAGSIVALELLDNMWKFDVPLADVPNFSIPNQFGVLVNAVCNHCGVILATQQFHGYQYRLTVAPEQDMNCREFLQYVAMISCNFCVIDDTGRLVLKWYDTSARPSDFVDGGTFNTTTTPYSDGAKVNGGNFTNYRSGKDVDGGTFIENINVAWFTRNFSTTVGTDEIDITGVKFIIDDVPHRIGTDGYVLELENPLVTEENVNDVLNLIWDVLEGFELRTFNVSTLPDIAAEVGDLCAVKDLKGNMVYSYITLISFNLTSQTVECNAVTPTRQLTSRYSKSVQAAVEEARKRADTEISRYDVAVQMMNNLAVNAMGAYQNYEDLETGGRVYYLSNKPITKIDGECSFVDTSTVFKITGEGFFVSEPSDPPSSVRTWVNGYSHGELVVNVLNAIGIHADWIETGLLRDKDGYNYWDLDHNIFHLATTTTVGDKTVQQIANEAQAAAEATSAQALATAVSSLDDDIADLQNQIDGNIATWFYSGVPTLNNLPASQWTTTEEKNNHLGDLYYDTDTDYAYRFMLEGSTYKWDKLSDADISAALRAAQDAQATADSKIITYAQTTAPSGDLDVGDLWIDTDDNNKLYRWNGTQWVAVPDSSALNAFKNGDYATFVTNTNNSLNAKITTYYQTSAPTTTIVGDLWIDTDDSNKLYRWSGTQWVLVRDTGIQSALTAAANAQTTADGKIVTYAQTSAPTGDLDTGDLWIDTDDNNKLYRWNGSQWVALSDKSEIVAYDNQLNQLKVFNKLTNNGQAQGIFLQNNELYIHASYLATGIIADATQTNFWNLDNGDLQMTAGVKLKVDHPDYSGAYVPTMGNAPASSWTTSEQNKENIGKSFKDTSTNGKTYIYKKTDASYPETAHPYVTNEDKKYRIRTGLTAPVKVKFDSQCETESSYDYLDVFYVQNSTWYKKRFTGAFGGAELVVPSNYVYLVWHSDSTVTKWGWKIDSISETTESPSTFTEEQIPSGSYDVDYCAYEWDEYTIDSYTRSVSQYDINSSMTQEEIFNTLTNYGDAQGLYLYNGKIYLNGQYVQAKSIKASDISSDTMLIGGSDFSDNAKLTVKNTSDVDIVRLDKDGVWAQKGVIGDLSLANGELYNIGNLVIFPTTTYNIYYKTYTTARSIRHFRPSKMDVYDSTFTLTVEYTVNETTSLRQVYLYLEHFVNNSWVTLESEFLQNTAGTYTKAFTTVFSKTDSSKYRLQIYYVSGTYDHSITMTVYAPNVRTVSLSPLSIWGAHRGTFVGTGSFNSADCDSLTADSITVIDSGDDNIEISPSEITRTTGENTYTVRWQSSSDERIKENIEPLDYDLSRGFIDATQTKRFKYKNVDGIHYGMIAQETRELLDNLGETESTLEYSQGDLNVNDQRAINYEEYIPHLINYVKDLRAELNRVKTELNRVKTELNELKEGN